MAMVRREPSPPLRGHVSSYYGYREETGAPLTRREGPGADVVVILTFEEDWLIDGEPRTSFVGGLRNDQVTTEHQGRSHGMQVNIVPTSAYRMLGVPMSALASKTVPLEDVLGNTLPVERLAKLDWAERFELVDAALTKRLDYRPVSSHEVEWAWHRLRATHGGIPIADLARELGWSRKRIVARFREEVGLTPKAAARLFRFEHARELAGHLPWAEVAFECGYYDQSHLINDFRAVTGRSPETFLQDTVSAAA